MLLWSITDDDVVHGLRERGLLVTSLDDLTTKKRSLLHQHADCALTEATRELIDSLAAQIRRGRGREEWSE